MSSTNGPDQRHYPGEGHGKCNPERDAAPPLFPNQVDPPPQHPWPATSDEGNTVPPPRMPPPPHHDKDETTSQDGGGRPA
jgi:hypothetical protein